MTRRNKHSRPVYSTDAGRLCPSCGAPAAPDCCGSEAVAPPGDGIVRLQRQSKGRGGKTVTLITGLPLQGPALKTLAKQLKQQCGVGGAIKPEGVELQGDQRQMLKSLLEQQGFVVKLSGG
ncbi:MAG: stress response translation initiation inhibitor YciH [Pseudomonadota bacterium]